MRTLEKLAAAYGYGYALPYFVPMPFYSAFEAANAAGRRIPHDFVAGDILAFVPNGREAQDAYRRRGRDIIISDDDTRH